MVKTSLIFDVFAEIVILGDSNVPRNKLQVTQSQLVSEDEKSLKQAATWREKNLVYFNHTKTQVYSL